MQKKTKSGGIIILSKRELCDNKKLAFIKEQEASRLVRRNKDTVE